MCISLVLVRSDLAGTLLVLRVVADSMSPSLFVIVLSVMLDVGCSTRLQKIPVFNQAIVYERGVFLTSVVAFVDMALTPNFRYLDVDEKTNNVIS